MRLRPPGGHTSQKTAKNGIFGAPYAKQEVEIWRQPKNSTFWPWFLFDSKYIWGPISHRYGSAQV